MPADPAIAAALRAAAFATCDREAKVICWCMADNLSPCATRIERDAAAIAAFLRALPDVIRSTPFGANSDGMLHTRQTYFAGDLAAAVEEAARDA